MTPDEIRALYVETLARADYADWLDRVRVAAARWDEECEHLPWDEQPDKGEWGRDHWRRIHTRAVDALAAAGLLPTGIEWGAGEVEDHTADAVRTVPHDVHEDEKDARADALANGEPLMQRYTHDWREVVE